MFGNGAGVGHQYLGVLATTLGNYDRGEHHLQRALATHERLAAPYWTGQTRLALAQLARTRPAPDLAAARALAGETLEGRVTPRVPHARATGPDPPRRHHVRAWSDQQHLPATIPLHGSPGCTHL